MTAGCFIPGVNRFWGSADRTFYSDHEISGSEFDNCHFPRSQNAGEWNIIRNVNASNVVNCNSSADTVCFQNVVVNNLKRGGRSPLFLWGCVFDRVELRGSISAIKINRRIDPLDEGSEAQLLWDHAVIEFYSGVEWALDISAAKFSGAITFEAIPGDKIRIDPSHQAVIRRESLVSGEWEQIDFGDTAMDVGIRWFLSDSLFDSVVLAASTASRTSSHREVEVLERLRDAGIAEPS